MSERRARGWLVVAKAAEVCSDGLVRVERWAIDRAYKALRDATPDGWTVEEDRWWRDEFDRVTGELESHFDFDFPDRGTFDLGGDE